MASVYLDIIAIAVIFLAGIVGVCRGFFGSLLSLLGFVGTFVLAYFLTEYTLQLLNSICGFTAFFQSFAGSTLGQVLATLIAFTLTYFAIKLVIFILNHTVGLLFKGKTFGGMNKFMGGLIGLVKGCAYVAIIMVAINLACLIPSVDKWATTAFSQTYFIGNVYNWVGDQMNVYFGQTNQTQQVEAQED